MNPRVLCCNRASPYIGPRGGWSRGLIFAQESLRAAPAGHWHFGTDTRRMALPLAVVASGQLELLPAENLNTVTVTLQPESADSDKLPARLADNCLVHSTGSPGKRTAQDVSHASER